MSQKKAKLINFEKMFKITLNALRINRSHPSIPRNTNWLIQFFIMHGVFTLLFIIILFNVYLSIKLENYSDACRNSVVSLTYCITSSKYFILVANQKTLDRIMNMMKSDFAKDMTEDEMEIVYTYARKGRKVCFQWMILAICAPFVFLAKNILLELYTFVIDEWKLISPFPLIYPSLVEENKQNPVIYTIIYLVLVYYGVYSAVMYMAFVPLGPIFMLHANGQLEIVNRKAMALYNSNEETRDKLDDIVRHLQYIYGFIDCIQEAFKVVYEFTLKATAISLPITVYEVLESFNRGEFSIEFISFIFAGVLSCSVPCYYSDMLMDKGEEVRLAMYSCGWESRYDHGVRKNLSMVLLRALRPTVIHTMFRTVCLDALTDLFHQAYTIFNLLNAAWG